MTHQLQASDDLASGLYFATRAEMGGQLARSRGSIVAAACLAVWARLGSACGACGVAFCHGANDGIVQKSIAFFGISSCTGRNATVWQMVRSNLIVERILLPTGTNRLSMAFFCPSVSLQHQGS